MGQAPTGERLSGFHIRLVLLCSLITLFEGLDLSIATYTAPYVRDAFRFSPDQLAWIFSAGTVGQILGGVSFAYVADRIGRRPVLVASTLLSAGLTAANGLANSFETLSLLRLLDGAAIGGMVPVVWALVSESMPPTRRAFTAAGMIAQLRCPLTLQIPASLRHQPANNSRASLARP